MNPTDQARITATRQQLTDLPRTDRGLIRDTPEFHTVQASTRIHPGQNLDLDYSVMRTLTPRQDIRVQLGLVGYGQWQTTDKRGPDVTPEQAAAHYLVNALGFASNIAWPQRRASLGFKYFRELRTDPRCRVPVQISGSIGSDASTPPPTSETPECRPVFPKESVACFLLEPQ
jgi:hypothetical protein